MRSISQILKFLGVQNLSEDDFEIQSLYLDSRKCDSGSAFIALKGQTTDGNKYINTVISQGVSLVFTDSAEFEDGNKVFYVKDLKDKLANLAIWFYAYKKPSNIIGITGTNGKTSISNYIAQFLDLNAQKTLLLGTNGNGIYPNLKESSHTTLDVLSLYQTTSSYSDYQNLVMEVSSHSLDQKRTEGLDFDIAVFSNLSHDHLDYHKTMQSYFEAKAKLFKFDSLRKAVINIDDDYGQKLCDLCSCEVITVSLKSNQADVYIDVKAIENMQTSFELYAFQEYLGIYQTALVGEFNLMNLALSFAALDGYLLREELLENIINIRPVKGRMEIIQLYNGAKVIIDYAHTPDALEKALQTLQDYSQNTLWSIFGCGGDRDATKRPEMAKIAEKYADKIIVTEDNNRFENIDNIFNDIKKGFNNVDQHKFIPSRKNAIEYAIEKSKIGDIILLAGKGHECYLDKNGVKEYFDEREVVRKYK
ncbi:UDP-N-acetylmuramoyl-L-alanyl-D-glutamate--2,6-diaminopimelate ligase [Francisella sp. LA112445]|uniref:UDP-N-acetylmuramoyl-L-alanyl-D-glutamate--2, 6-diaminopimelate ligase n=1 Tax=Francisella sp. LA112445 TaxID=1395624 RepID=UPI001788C29C|nr:UDP-N-acetylmuramoyl-L-alanyl-D-glutamate--2,6-diaminopimelate ligase [Francisella sp. LA112445]QIW10673.1 UDP-N-acetylmuramoyl-L-alanyl-D-glutamate--2,6-diaminopimelate ligase [Francisella sp. LA112445]